MRRRMQCPLFVLAMALLLSLAALQLVLPEKARSDWENRPLATGSAPTWASVVSGRWMQAMEDVAADQLPGRQGWMQLNALWETLLLRTERNGVLLGSGGRRFEACTAADFDMRTAEANLEALEALAARTGRTVRLLLAPLSSAVYGAELPWQYPAADQGALLRALDDKAVRVNVVDVLPSMRERAEEMLYYRLDHHWTAAGARVAYEALAAQWEQQPAQPAQTLAEDGFYGAYFAQAPSPLCAPDTLTFDLYDGVTLRVETEEKDLLFNPDAMAGRDKYAALLWGNYGRITLENPDAPRGTLLVLKDSYANALLPALAQHFSRVVALDLRYYAGDVLEETETMEAEEIVCLYGLSGFAEDRNLAVHGLDWGA
ncbi:MAG: DHHW family protein [Christensenellales bacterium]|uniref:AlgX/AlgJ SGNH hydrolase-like domain-containing protein n=1 Tax=Candidatus Avichristensenella intestinipullorum TaxID=2840693 RepID=A0A9D0YW31_9FIRM|nr:DHHW family protein [Christensenellales bacterium]HIQ63296.1 hypothetical protein [Candidatus Avichristensenella intestinipullorum]